MGRGAVMSVSVDVSSVEGSLVAQQLGKYWKFRGLSSVTNFHLVS